MAPAGRCARVCTQAGCIYLKSFTYLYMYFPVGMGMVREGARRWITALTLGPSRAPSSQCAHIPLQKAAHKGASRFERRFVKRGVTDEGMTAKVNRGHQGPSVTVKANPVCTSLNPLSNGNK